MNWRMFAFEGATPRLMAFTALTKPIGLMTQVLIASLFGAGYQLDAYAFALLPVLFCSQTIQRIFTAVAVPQIVKVRQEMSEDQVHAYQNALALVYHLPILAILVVFIAAGDSVIALLGARLPHQTRELSGQMLRVLAIPGILACFEGFFSTILQANKRFLVPGFLPALNAAVMLGSLFALHTPLGIWALPAGYAVSRAIQTPLVIGHALRTRVFRWIRPSLPRRHLSLLWQLSWLIVITQTFLVINTFVDKWFATGLEEGSISSINYSMTLMTFGQELFALSLVVVMFTRMSEFLARRDMAGCDGYIGANLLRVTNLVTPVSLGLLLISPELIRVLFQRGAFEAQDALRTSGALRLYLLGMPAFVVNAVVARIFQSLQRLREKVWLALQFLATNVIGNAILVNIMGIKGLAISSSVAINLHLLLSLLVLLRFRNGLGAGRYLMIIARAYAMALVTWLLYTVSGADSLAWNPGGGGSLAGAILTGALKFSIVLALYAAQVAGWLVHRSARRRAAS